MIQDVVPFSVVSICCDLEQDICFHCLSLLMSARWEQTCDGCVFRVMRSLEKIAFKINPFVFSYFHVPLLIIPLFGSSHCATRTFSHYLVGLPGTTDC